MKSVASKRPLSKRACRFCKCSSVLQNRSEQKLQGKAPKTFLALTEPHILVGHNLTPSDTASMNRANVLGIATDLGSRTSHAAILARSLGIPAVVGLHDITAKLETGQHVLLDGSDGCLI